MALVTWYAQVLIMLTLPDRRSRLVAWYVQVLIMLTYHTLPYFTCLPALRKKKTEPGPLSKDCRPRIEARTRARARARAHVLVRVFVLVLVLVRVLRATGDGRRATGDGRRATGDPL